jgi:hypothetical protein
MGQETLIVGNGVSDKSQVTGVFNCRETGS